MRLYGSSPLYSYVELIFRCKRLFIIAIVLGAVISGVMAMTKPTSYNASMLIGLAGEDPELAAQLPTDRSRVQGVSLSNQRKYTRLNRFLSAEADDFLEKVALDDGSGYINTTKHRSLVALHPDLTMRQIVVDLRKNITVALDRSDVLMELKITWPYGKEAEDILTSVFNLFSERNYSLETRATRDKIRIISDQYAAAEKEAFRLASKKTAYQRDNFNAIPAMLSAQVGRSEQSRIQLEDLRLDLLDSRQRLADINQQLGQVPKEIVENRQETGTIDNPVIGMASEYDDLNRQYKQLSAVYSPQHPKIVDLQKRMVALQQQIDEKKQELRNKPQVPKSTTSLVSRTSNPEYRELSQQKRELERTVKATSRKVAELERIVTSSQQNLRSMPSQEIAWQKLESDYQLADQIRTNRKAQLAQLTLDKQVDDAVKRQEVSITLAPKAQRMDTKGKTYVMAALGPLLAIVMAFCFSLLLETMDHTLRTPVEAEKYLNKPVLAVIPKMAAARDSRKQLGGSSKTGITS